jgi:glutamyl-tRNA reductase
MRHWKTGRNHIQLQGYYRRNKEFNVWTKGRKFAPTIHALKKSRTMKVSELNFQSKKIADFNEEQAEIISARIIQKSLPNCKSFKDDDTMVDRKY